MAATYLQLVNQVLVRLRESQVTDVAANSYSVLIGALVNDSKREVEDAWQWSVIQDYIAFNTIIGTYQYDISTVNTHKRGTPATDRSRLWIDPTSDRPWLVNTSPGQEATLTYEATYTDLAIKLAMVNQNAMGPPGVFQVLNSPTVITAGQWNKQLNLYQIPDKVYSMRLLIINPQNDLVNNTDVCLTPTAPIVLKAYLFALYERGEELGEMLTITTDKVEQSLSDAIAFDNVNHNADLGLHVPTGAQY